MRGFPRRVGRVGSIGDKQLFAGDTDVFAPMTPVNLRDARLQLGLVAVKTTAPGLRFGQFLRVRDFLHHYGGWLACHRRYLR